MAFNIGDRVLVTDPWHRHHGAVGQVYAVLPPVPGRCLPVKDIRETPLERPTDPLSERWGAVPEKVKADVPPPGQPQAVSDGPCYAVRSLKDDFNAAEGQLKKV